MEKPKKAISEFYQCIKKNDDLYRSFQKYSGLSDAEYWCLSAVRSGECSYQHEISEYMFLSRQTIHSALKHLIQKGLICLITPEENQRIKEIVFTEKGEAFAEKYLDIMIQAEENAWFSLTPKEQDSLVHIINKLNKHLETELQNHIQK